MINYNNFVFGVFFLSVSLVSVNVVGVGLG